MENVGDVEADEFEGDCAPALILVGLKGRERGERVEGEGRFDWEM